MAGAFSRNGFNMRWFSDFRGAIDFSGAVYVGWLLIRLIDYYGMEIVPFVGGKVWKFQD